MTCASPNKPREPSVGAIAIGLLVCFILGSLAMGLVTTHYDSAAVRGLLNGLPRSDAALDPTYAD